MQNVGNSADMFSLAIDERLPSKIEINCEMITNEHSHR